MRTLRYAVPAGVGGAVVGRSRRRRADCRGQEEYVNAVDWDVVVVLVIVLIGGFFAAAEMALVSLRDGQVRTLSKRGRRGQRAARLAQNPNRFLSAVQIGVTFATLLSGAFGAATLASALKSALRHHMSSALASALSIAIVTLAISFLTLVFGELAPKRIALQRSERVSLFAAPILDRLATVATPLVWLLSKSVNLVVAVLGGDPNVGRGVMTELELLPATMPISEAAEIVRAAPHTRFPVYQESYDDVIGFVHARDLFAPGAERASLRVGEVCRPVKFLPTSKTVLSALSEMRSENAHLAIVMDEYGGTAGIVTLEDLVEELIGEIRDEYDVDQAQSRQLRSGELEVDGLLNLDEFAEQTGVELPEGPYETVAGYLLAALGHLPGEGESVEVSGRKLAVIQLDGRRIARVRVGQAASVAADGRQDPGQEPD